MTETNFVGVQFKPIGKTYTFSLPAGLEVEKGSQVIVNTSRGKQIGRVAAMNLVQPENGSEVQAIERLAVQEDLQKKAEVSEKEEQVVDAVAKYLRDPGHDGIKVVEAEYSLDGSRLTIYLNYETGIDFNPRNFIRDISNLFRDCRIEVRQVGPRDAAKALSGIGSCGIEQRCCSRFLTEFSSISIKMAKSQDISLTPMEITGICGRLRCCLAYEHEVYEEARSKLPKKKKAVATPLGEGKVLQVMPLRDAVLVDLPEKGPREFSRTELETGILEEKTETVIVKDLGYLSHDEDIEVIQFESPKPREERNRNRRDNQPESVQPTGGTHRNVPREGQHSSRHRKPTGDKRNAPAEIVKEQIRQLNQGETKRVDHTAHSQEPRKSGSGRRRKSRPPRDQSTAKTPRED